MAQIDGVGMLAPKLGINHLGSGCLGHLRIYRLRPLGAFPEQTFKMFIIVACQFHKRDLRHSAPMDRAGSVFGREGTRINTAGFYTRRSMARGGHHGGKV